jgi:hypothetical protein
VRSNNRGISLIELLVIIILISTIATAYLNFQEDTSRSAGYESRYSVLDSALYAAVDIIANDLRLTRKIKPDGENPLVIEHLADTDIVKVKRANFQREYLVDENGRLIRIDNNGCFTLAGEIVSLRARELGQENVVLTITARMGGTSYDGKDKFRSYSRVATVNFPLN